MSPHTAGSSADPAQTGIPASFRDPAGCLLRLDGRIFRFVTRLGIADLNAFLQSPAAGRLMGNGAVIGTRLLDDAERAELLSRPGLIDLYRTVGAETVVEHESVAFPSYPYEWPPEMLHAAASLTLEIARSLLDDNLGLKDASPYNVLFRGPHPVFIDVLSFERRASGDATWLPYAQFVRTFLLPLLANRRFGLAFDRVLLTRRDGLEPEEVYRWLGPLDRLLPPSLSLVSLPVCLGRRHDVDDPGIYRKNVLADPAKARYILGSLLNGLARALRRLAPAAGKTSVWSDYATSNNNYTAQHQAAKKEFVESAMAEFRPRRVLDVGCNTGLFSAIAARSGAQVVAIDYDPVVLGEVWRAAREERLDILPLAVNLTRPTPGTGWLNAECPSFLDRARGRFDAVLMLAVIHHMLVTERVPLPRILDLAADLTTGLFIVEFIAPEDSMFRRLTRGREELHRDLTATAFEEACRSRFEIVRVSHLEGTSRWLYACRKR